MVGEGGGWPQEVVVVVVVAASVWLSDRLYARMEWKHGQ